MGKVVIEHYHIHSDRHHLKRKIRLAFISDTHGCFQEKSEEILKGLKEISPDYILLGGDLVTRGDAASIEDTFIFLEAIKEMAPCYCAFGNHEMALDKIAVMGYSRKIFLQELENIGIHCVYNQNLSLEDGQVSLAGLCLPLDYFGRKSKSKILEKEDISYYIGDKKEDSFQILLAHHPKYYPGYARWGANLVLSGHLHGGVIQLPYLGGVINTEISLFPPYTKGLYQLSASKMIVTSGLGEHGIKVRINNPREIVSVTLET